MSITSAMRYTIIISVVVHISASHACLFGTQHALLESSSGTTVNTSSLQWCDLPESENATEDCALVRYQDPLDQNISRQLPDATCSDFDNVTASSVGFLLCSTVVNPQHSRGCLVNLTEEPLLKTVEAGRIVYDYRSKNLFLVCCNEDSHHGKGSHAQQGLLQNLASVLQKSGHFNLFNNTQYKVVHCSTNLVRHSEEEHCLSFPIWRTALPFINVCRAISLICLLLKMILFVALKQFQSFSSKCVMALSVTMFFTIVFIYLASNLYNAHKVLFIAAHYGCLSSASWTTVLSYDIWSRIVSMSSKRGGNFYGYCCFGWGLPLLIMAICTYCGWGITSCGVSPIYGMVLLTTGYGKRVSWILFAVPMFVMLVVNLGFYVHIVVVIKRTVKDVEKNVTRGTENYSQAWLFAKLAMIMGVGWLLACLARLIPVLALCCLIFDMSKSLQGMYLFVGFQDHKHFAELWHSRKSSWHLARKRGSSSAYITRHEVPLYCVEVPQCLAGTAGSFKPLR